MKVPPIVRQSLADIVVQRLRDLIDREQLGAGDRLPTEQELLQQLQVSRPVLREAIARLESIGLISSPRGRGEFFVSDRAGLASCAQMVRTALTISPRDVLKYAEVRWAIECFAARRAAELATQEDLAELEQLLEQMDRPDQDHLESIRIDFQFHRKLIDITGNEVMQNMMEVIHAFVMAGMVHTTPKPRDRSWSRPLHQGILDAVRSASPEAAEAAMRVHMESVIHRLQAATKRPRQARR
ncbi:MAG: FadR family transcriptional regulator [Gemmataceae bacterium]|nr:FadR family transcriptional regulator [Gemmataceae bacterium]